MKKYDALHLLVSLYTRLQECPQFWCRWPLKRISQLLIMLWTW